mmetsp:Transcript_9777/g.12209  ORF Transcript_9777/g.12209 Transcript_9777/m.12209 type:complete len:135 (-) Transcript_9777:1956-2360(-)
MAFLLSSAVLLRFGAIGLVFANSVNMILRILFSMRYILKWQDPSSQVGAGNVEIQSPLELLPSISVWFTFGASFITTRLSSTLFYQDFASFPGAMMHVAIGGAALLICGFVTYKSEGMLVRDLKDVWRMRRKNE